MHIPVLLAAFSTCDFQFMPKKEYSCTSSSRRCSGTWLRMGGHIFEPKIFWSTVTKLPYILPFWSGVSCIVTCLLTKSLTSSKATCLVTEFTVYHISHLLIISRGPWNFCKWRYIKKHPESYRCYLNDNEFLNWLFPHWQTNVVMLRPGYSFLLGRHFQWQSKLQINFLLNNQPEALIIQIYSVIKLYMFRATSLLIIRSFLLYIRH